MFFRLFLTAIIIFINTSLYALIILIHGSFATNNPWYKPGGDFFEGIATYAQEYNHAVIPFTWSGAPFQKEINLAAKDLALFIATCPCEEEIIIVGHSHGGNVAIKATQLLSDAYKNQQSYKDLVLTASINSMLQTSDETKKRISRLYLLGTPIDNKHYFPAMNMVDKVCSLFSKNDAVQKVFGMYERRLKNHKNRSNLKTYLNDKEPDHTKLHHKIIGKWLLTIPDNMQEIDPFVWGIDGQIMFYDHQPPIYSLVSSDDAKKKKS